MKFQGIDINALLIFVVALKIFCSYCALAITRPIWDAYKIPVYERWVVIGLMLFVYGWE